MSIHEYLGKQLLFFDGAMGTELQKAGLAAGIPPDLAVLSAPDLVRAIHRAYLDAGCHILSTNTFGANRIKLAGHGHTVAEVVRAAVALAKQAIAEAERDGVPGPHFVAMDIGPSGKLLAPLGDLPFEDAYEAFHEAALAGARAGADCILIETMSDTYELKAAVLAAKATGLPVLATATVDGRGKLLTGADMPALAALLSGLGVTALGLNCGFGAKGLLPCLRALGRACDVPLILNPNAGLPQYEDGRTFFSETPEAFAQALEEAAEAGAWLLGGCCGTTPAHLRAMTDRLKGFAPLPIAPAHATVVSSGLRAVTIGGRAPVLIGERINPTGKPAMKRALREGNHALLLREAVRQQEAGAEILDVNAGLPDIDEASALARLVPAIQAVCDLPLQIDTASPGALAGAMRLYNGKPMVNSVSGKAESMEAVFPLVKKYGGVVVALTLDEGGIPPTAEGRVEIARRIVETAKGYGIGARDIVIDPLTMAVSAEPPAARVVLQALSRIRDELGVQTVLGVSNISFGLPSRETLNAAFFTLAAGAGLSAAIVNPFSAEMMRAHLSLKALSGEDAGCAGYVAALAAEEASAPDKAQRAPGSVPTLSDAIRQGLSDEARALAASLVETRDPLSVIEAELIPALNAVGLEFEKGTAYLPQLLRSAEAARAAFEALSKKLSPAARGGRGKVVLATVRGDIHDIGKNIVKSLLENYRFDVIDLGRDVPPEAIVQAVREHGATLVGLSALMTTTVGSMEETIRLLRLKAPGCRVMVGGAVLTAEYAKRIGADQYARDAMDSVRYAQAVLG